MKTFYFTYGTDGQPFVGGWTAVMAPDRNTACAVFRAFHPDRIPGIINCADICSEESFRKSDMFFLGNLGAFCHEAITVSRTLVAQ